MNAPGSPEKPERGAGEAVGPSATEKWAARASEGEPRSRGGRPRGSRDRAPRKRRSSRSAEPEALETETAPPAEPPGEAEIAGVGKLLGVSWRILGGRFRRRPLAPDEERQLAEAAIPVLAKYGGGVFEQWGAEISLGIVVIGLWDGTRLPDPPAKSSAVVLDQGEQGDGG